MRMMMSDTLLFFRCSYVFIFLVLQKCYCMNPANNICSPSSCGSIHNISYPFRLKLDPKHCGNPFYELECENNATTILKLSSQKFKVKAINYINNTMWVADVSVNNNNTCYFPNISLNYNFFDDTTPYYYTPISMQISLMRCPYPLKNSVVFTELSTHCNSSTHTYINIGRMTSVSDVGENCTLYPSVLTLSNFTKLENASVSEIHHSLLSGFQLSWIPDWKVLRRMKCHNKNGFIVSCRHGGVGGMVELLWGYIKRHPFHRYGEYGPNEAIGLIFLLILVVVFAGVSIPAKIILGFSAPAFIIFVLNQERQYPDVYLPVERFPIFIGLFFAVRFITVFPCIIWFFIYKFRRRHLSRFAVIEEFLQSENNIVPIRYSYSDIKKMTRGFRETLGQGGYGTVYKGKLRSGYDVAVKLLGNLGENDRDFKNEIATIGRIHHVNVVKLVGYCAERSKRALVFDYMPNGSLDKYLYSRENINCLSWERKYKIAIGVARGIQYLHRGCDIQILHFDIKPHNILLDGNFTPKITDFGLAKFFSTDKNVVTMTAIRGTIGYVAPELINRGFGEVSYKADVYSFGMLLMEMVGLNKDLKQNNQASSQYFPGWIYDCFEHDHDIEIEATDAENNDTNINIAKKMTIVALWCIQMCPADRPPMNKVVEMLEDQVERLQIPNRASQSAQVAVVNDKDQSWSTYSTDIVSLVPHDATASVEITVED